MSNHRACCCGPCACPETLTLELRGEWPINIACPSNAPTSPPFAVLGPFFDCTGAIVDQIETISIVSQGTGSNLPCYFSTFRRWCAPAGGTPSWPLVQDWAANVNRTLCPTFPNAGGITPCPIKIGAPPTTSPYGFTDGHAVVTYESSYDSLNSRHRIFITAAIPTWNNGIWDNGSSFSIRAFKTSTARDCFPRGQWQLFNTTNDSTHGWVETHVTSFNNTTGVVNYTTTRRDVSVAPFQIWVT